MSRRIGALGTGAALVGLCLAIFAVGIGARLGCRDVCGSDIGHLYEARRVDRGSLPYVDRPLEYPPLIGIVMYVAGLPGNGSPRVSFVFNAVGLALLAAMVTWLLWRHFGARTRRWLLAPPLIFEGLINWDLVAVAPAVGGLLIWSRSAFWAGALLGVGAAAKLFPGLYVAMLVADCVPAREWRRAGQVIAGAVLAVATIVVPLLVVAPDAVGYFLDFHAARSPTRGTILSFILRNPALPHSWVPPSAFATIGTITSTSLTGVALGLLVMRVALGKLDAIPACAIGTIAFLLANKVYSPQYDLWLVPFFVMLPVRDRLVAHFYASSFIMFLLSFAFSHFVPGPLFFQLNGAGIIYRAAVLLAISRDLLWPAAGDRSPGLSSTRRLSVRSTRRASSAPARRG
jgi:hypothetical protein